MSENMKKLILDSVKQNPDCDIDKKNSPSKRVSVDDLKLFGGATRVVDLGSMKYQGKVKKLVIRVNVFQWTDRDIALYINERYYSKYNHPWGMNLVGATKNMGRMKKALFDTMGFCDAVVVKDYVDYFFDFWADLLIVGQDKILYFNSLMDPGPVKEFVQNYNYSERVTHYIGGNDEKYEGAVPTISLSKIETSYKLGLDNLILDYGVVLAVNLLLRNGKSLDEAMDATASAVARICRTADAKLISDITNTFGPYSKNMRFIDMDKLSGLIRNKIGKEIVFNTIFLDNIDRWKYFDHERNNEE